MKRLALLVTLVVAGWLGFAAAQPPAAVGADAPATAFSAERAMADVRIIAREPHPTGSAANDTVRAHLAARLGALGFTVRQTTIAFDPLFKQHIAKRGAPADTAVNIIGLRPGRDPAAPAVVVMAHYDSVPGSPGAADDAAGVAAALEIARAIPRGAQARDLVILLTDGEEGGLVGARDFFGRHLRGPATVGDPLAGRTGAVINLESRGGGGRAMMFETGPDNGNMARLFQRVVGNPAANSLAVKIYELLPNSTDFTPAKKRGIAGYNFAFLGDPRQYHSPVATPEALDQRSLQHLGGQALDLTRALLTEPGLPGPAPDMVFSDVLGLGVIAYPPVVGWLVVAGVAGVILFIARRRRADWTWRQVAGGAAGGAAFLLVAALLLAAGNWLSGGGEAANYYDRLAALPRLEIQALLLIVATLALVVGVSGCRSDWGGWTGLALLSLVFGVAVQALLPAAAPIFAWPLLLAVIAMLPVAHRPQIGGFGLVAPMVAAILGLAFIGGFAHFFLLGIGITTPSAVTAFAPQVLLLLWPLLPDVRRRPAVLAALVLIGVAAGLALWVRLDDRAISVPVYANDK